MAITTVAEVKTVAGFTNEYSDVEIETEIDIVEAELYQKYNLPKRSQFSIIQDISSNPNYDYYFCDTQKGTYEIIRAFVQVPSTEEMSGFLEFAIGSTTATYTSPNNYMTLDPTFAATYVNKIVRVQYIPRIHHLLATNICALNLMDGTTITHGNQVVSPDIQRIQDRIKRYKALLSPIGIIKSAGLENYDPFEYVSIDQLSKK